jgi:hypothetical protein
LTAARVGATFLAERAGRPASRGELAVRVADRLAIGALGLVPSRGATLLLVELRLPAAVA